MPANDHADHPHGHHHHVVPMGGPVILDIGGDVGALILYVDDDQLGTEIHVRADHDPDPLRTTHTGVWERTMGGQPVVVAVFLELVEDGYRLLDADGQVTQSLTIRGGQITEIDLRADHCDAKTASSSALRSR
jgi:hypothetical protein